MSPAAVIDAGLGLLRCPVCADGFTRVERTLRCTAGHSFDLARQGYVNLLGHAAPANADTAAMVAARERFLGAGHYAPIAAAVAAAVGPDGAVVEVGAGTGHYLATALGAGQRRPHLAMDVSAAACRASARAGLASAVADTWAGLTLADGSVSRLICVFAPRNPAEFVRVLDPGGELIMVTPTAAHLAQLRAQLGLLDVPADKAARLDADLAASGLILADRERVEFALELTADQVADLIAMGPNAFHGATEQQTEATVTMASVLVSRYRAG